jgi:hypothetical protein
VVASQIAAVAKAKAKREAEAANPLPIGRGIQPATTKETDMYTFTLAQARRCHPCADGWATALTAHGPDLDRPLTLAAQAAAQAAWVAAAEAEAAGAARVEEEREAQRADIIAAFGA